MQLCLVGNPENRRVRDFQAAAVSLGGECPPCLSWLELLQNRSAAEKFLVEADSVRLESPGENDKLLHRLIRLGGGTGQLAFGQIGYLRQQYQGFCELLHWLERMDLTFQNSPADIRVMFDKWESHLRFAQADLRRPWTRLAPENLAEFYDFRTSCGTVSSGRLFLKPRYASSASGVCAYRWSHDREQLIAPVEIERQGNKVRLFNSLRVRTYTSYEDIRGILGALLPEGMIAERWIRKAALPDGQFDLRVLVIAGQARHVVVRQSHSPMTNLHLGNRRGDIAEVRAACGEQIYQASLILAEQAAACFTDSLYAGVDIMIPARGEPVVGEINAFGDLLPGVKHDGQTAYEAILEAPHGIRHSF